MREPLGWVSSGNPRNSNGTTCHSITGFPCNIGSWVTVHPRVSQNTGLRTPGPPLPPDRKAIDGTILFELKASGIRRHCIWFQTLHLVSPHKALRIIGSTFPFGVPNGTQKVTLASQSQPVFQRDEPWCIVWHCTNNSIIRDEKVCFQFNPNQIHICVRRKKIQLPPLGGKRQKGESRFSAFGSEYGPPAPRKRYTLSLSRGLRRIQVFRIRKDTCQP